MPRALLLLLVAAAVAAADAPRTLIGLRLAEPTNFDPGAGLEVVDVVPGTTAEALRVQVGDRLLRVGAAAVADLAAFGAAVASVQVGDRLDLVVQRGGAEVPLTGTVIAAPRARELGERAQALEREVGAVRRAAEDRPLRLEEVLALLQRVEHDLPIMAADFKKSYPQGRFNISIRVDLSSDAAGSGPAVQPAPVEDRPASTAPVAAPATGSGN